MTTSTRQVGAVTIVDISAQTNGVPEQKRGATGTATLPSRTISLALRSRPYSFLLALPSVRNQGIRIINKESLRWSSEQGR